MANSNQGNPTSTPLSGLALAINKIETVDVPQGKTVALAYSGGLDSTLCFKLLEHKYHAKQVIAISADVGQGEDEITISKNNAQKLGITPVIIDIKAEFPQNWLTKAIQANSDYNH